MSETSVGIRFNPSQRPGVRLALDPGDPERLWVRSRLGLGRLLFGGLVALFSAYGQLDSWQGEEWAAFTFATLAAWGGLALLTLRRRLVLDRREGVVEISRGAFLPHFRRRESLARFDRVSIILGGQRSGKGVTTTYRVQLEGRDVKILDPEMGGPRTLLAHFTHGVLVARSDRESVRFGYGMRREELAWLRAEIVSVLGARDKAAPRLTAHPVARRFGGALAGLGLGILAAHLTRGPLTPCIAIPFLQHILSVGAALGLSAGLLMRRLRGPALFAVLVALALSAGGRERGDFVQERPMLKENPDYLRSSESIGIPPRHPEGG